MHPYLSVINKFLMDRRSPVAALDRELEKLAKSREATRSSPLLVVSVGNFRDPDPA